MTSESEIKVSINPYNALNDDIVTEKILRTKFVTDGIADDYKFWTCLNSILISAQTGMGKNYFIENVLINYTMENNKQILIVSNRIATNRQQKERIGNLVGCERDLENLSSKGLDENEDFRNVRVITYQKLEKYFDDIFQVQKLKNFSLVVLDEAHFFSGDSLFNNKTGKILQNCLSTFKNSIRIFMTATPEEIFPILVEKEKLFYGTTLSTLNYMNNPNKGLFTPKEIFYYNFERSYEYVVPNYFNSKEEILEKINNDESQSKWLVFVTNKDIGEDLVKRIKHSSVFITAESKYSQKNDGIIYDQIVKTEAYDCKVLVATSALDNGINIKDPLLKNIVILSYDKSEFLQMLGRKRIDKDEKINLYICARKANNFNAKLAKVKNQIRALLCLKYDQKKFLDQYVTGTTSDSELVRGLFYFDNNRVPRFNDLATKKLYNDKIFYERITASLNSGDKEAFIYEQLSWLGLQDTFETSALLSNAQSDEQKISFIKYLDEHCNIELEGDSIDTFRAAFKIHSTIVYGERPGDRASRTTYGAINMNNVFKDNNLKYEIKIKNKIWILTKT